MRLWSVHPRYLDRQALVACWREGLLAQAVIGKSSGGYSNHPQLARFRECAKPLAALGSYLHGIVDEADARGYRFVRSKIVESGSAQLSVTDCQLAYEWSHLVAKLSTRSPDWLALFDRAALPDAHPLFTTVPDPIESWERPRQ